MKQFIAMHGKPIGGLCGIAAAGTLYFGYKPTGLILAVTAVALVIWAERIRHRK